MSIISTMRHGIRLKGRVVPLFLVVLGAALPAQAKILKPGLPLSGKLAVEWNSSRGLPSDMVFCITQTADGYIWIGTQRGLIRSDGLRPETLLPDPVYDLCPSRDGSLWICQGYRLLQYKFGNFVPGLTAVESLRASITRVYEDRKGDVWVGLRNGRLGRVKDGAFSQFPLPGNKEASMVSAIAEDAHGILWIGTMAGGLYKGRDGVFEAFDTGLSPDYAVFHIRRSRDGALWAATNLGLIRIQEDRAKILAGEIGFSSAYILDFLEDADGRFWVTTSRGLHLLVRDESGKFRASSLTAPDQVLDILFEDREKNLWISAPRAGLTCYQNAPFRTLSEEAGIPSYASALLLGRNGTVWLGDDVGILYRLEGGRARQVANLGYTPESGIVAMAEDPRGRIWLGTIRSGVHIVEDGKPVPLDAGRPLPGVQALRSDRRGGMWIGTSRGLVRVRDGGIKIFTTADGLPGNWISSLAASRNGRFWIGTNRGLAVVNADDRDRPDIMAVLLGPTVLSVIEDADRTIWAGTLNAGLWRIRDGLVSRCGRPQGLGSDTIYEIQDDDAGCLWMTSPAGVIRMAKVSWPDATRRPEGRLEASVYGKSDGVRGEATNMSTSNSIARLPDGEMWFAVGDGISIVAPRQITVNPFLPTPVLSRVLLDGREIPVGKSPSAFKGIRAARFEFAAPSFLSPTRMKIRYMLEGFDSDWREIEAAADKTADYPRLPFGAYRFRLTACNSDGIWNNRETVFAFTLKPRWTETSAFRAGTLILTLLLGGAAYFGFQRFYKQRKAKRKYKDSTLTPEKAGECAAGLIRLLEYDKVFTSPSVSLTSLAKRLQISTKDLSRVINERLNRNFWTLVNFYRIEEAKDRLAKAVNGDQTVLRIAMDVGFNSLAAFNRAFKKFAGMTPSEYRKSRGSKS